MDICRYGQGLKKKALTCGTVPAAELEAGRKIYNGHCYFCHGYSGDARTAAARYVNPPPRDFTTSLDLASDRIRHSIRDGRPNTAMKGFAGVLDENQIAAVASFVEEEFVRCGRVNTRYHTAENGWPDHVRRNGSAFPFVLGALPIDPAPDSLAPPERRGLAIFRESCIACHEGRVSHDERSGWSRASASSPGKRLRRQTPETNAHASGHEDEHHEDERYNRAYFLSEDDEAIRQPRLTGLTPQEAIGEHLYRDNCALCHAKDGSGRNWIGRFLQPNPDDLTDPAVAQRLTDARLRTVIRDGLAGTSMPAFGSVFGPDDIDATVAYLKRAFLDAKGR